ncbi:hypothetical protein [Pseudanabaena sp. FACHB-2040]|uniref:hypothetical protein n=1 Tax=Pseudanabaena sp. FACHB-2040 TaxID=2692859 RepID=UPI001687AFD2|nr:hypothetical protein [Pseudanabaena sp. FACHB-2040]MBD2257461.1 hypothetical protein [Pseudanabaena sp. FACHB-2040]
MTATCANQQFSRSPQSPHMASKFWSQGQATIPPEQSTLHLSDLLGESSMLAGGANPGEAAFPA